MNRSTPLRLLTAAALAAGLIAGLILWPVYGTENLFVELVAGFIAALLVSGLMRTL